MIAHDVHRAVLRAQVRSPRGAWITVAGSSMEPTAPAGTRVRVRARQEVQPGDVVVFESSSTDTWIVHRVVLVLRWADRFVHVGDRAGCCPGVARLSSVVGHADLPRRRARLHAGVGLARYAARRAWRRATRR